MTTIDEFLKKYNRCPFCKEYTSQYRCGECKYFLPIDKYRLWGHDLFNPTEEWYSLMNREVDEDEEGSGEYDCIN